MAGGRIWTVLARLAQVVGVLGALAAVGVMAWHGWLLLQAVRQGLP
jgi:hypothetical protein